MDGKMAFDGLVPSAPALVSGVLLDVMLGDPRYPFHPIRLIGATLNAFEPFLRRRRFDGYAGGCLLFLLLAATWVLAPSAIVYGLTAWNASAGFILRVFLVYSLFAIRDLFDHVWAVLRAARSDDLGSTREAIAR